MFCCYLPLGYMHVSSAELVSDMFSCSVAACTWGNKLSAMLVLLVSDHVVNETNSSKSEEMATMQLVIHLQGLDIMISNGKETFQAKRRSIESSTHGCKRDLHK
eukprot:1503579-Amphidinium_carterae.4